MTTTTTEEAPVRDPIISVGDAYSSMSPAGVDDFVRKIERDGFAVVTDSRHRRPMNHNIAGIGVGHNDVRWCETRFTEGSMAAFHENGESDIFPERWWERDNLLAMYDGRKARKMAAAR